MILFIFSILMLSFSLIYIKYNMKSALLINSWFCIIYLIASFNFLNFKPIGLETQFLVVGGVLFFNFGVLIVKIKKKQSLKIIKNRKKNILIGVLILLFSLYYCIVTIKLLQSGLPIGYIRVKSFAGDGGIIFKNRIIQLIFYYIVLPVNYAQFILGVEFYKIYKEKKILLLAVINLILYCVINVGRLPLLFLIQYFLVNLYIRYTTNKNVKIFSKKEKKGIIFFCGLLITFSYIRGKNKGSLFYIIINYFIKYFTGPLTALDMFINQNLELQLYGRATFGFLDLIVTPLLKIFFQLDIKSSLTIIGTLNNEFINISKTGIESFNALYTMFQIFYIDFRILGILGYSFLLGVIVSYLNQKWNKSNNQDCFSLMIVSYVTVMVINGIMKWELLSCVPFFTIIYLYINCSSKIGRKI